MKDFEERFKEMLRTSKFIAVRVETYLRAVEEWPMANSTIVLPDMLAYVSGQHFGAIALKKAHGNYFENVTRSIPNKVFDISSDAFATWINLLKNKRFADKTETARAQALQKLSDELADTLVRADEIKRELKRLNEI